MAWVSEASDNSTGCSKVDGLLRKGAKLLVGSFARYEILCRTRSGAMLRRFEL